MKWSEDRFRRKRSVKPPARIAQDRCASRLTRTRSAGVSPAEGQARPLVAWAAERRETDGLKPADKAIFWMVSELPGRSGSAREVAPKWADPEAESSSIWRRQHEDGISGRIVVLTPAG